MYPGTTTRLTHKTEAAAATMDANKDVIFLTGTTSIVTMNPRSENPSAQAQILFLVPTAGNVATTAAGNFIAAVTMLDLKVTTWIWNPSTSKWYPHALS